MKIGGLQKVSLIDYPGLICATVFLQGCNFKCSYCHNPELVEPRLFQPCIKENEVLAFLHTRKGKLDSVTITGGEPTIQDDLALFIKQIKKMGFAVKLDTNGSQPQVIKALLEEKLIDFIAMDIKGPLEKYAGIAGVPVAGEKIKESVNSILKARIPHEFRTTIVQSQLAPNDIFKISALITGAEKYALQRFVPVKTLNKKFREEKNYPDVELDKMKKRLEKEMTSVIVR
ncbi:MAG: anaerobic ribonucleoside-triphosphate reductase activating protein [Deltaproteobacteria bacterium HGW-Deltaproteobacteria-12]|jgi:pyruvate formate lyase activating enzyme|nr:MAG: anaerobic ribonucleoside-triphosphate reductase activating protein [Deltaproteobacteria bacterium HGW-Deltaproteobacteria-12]